MKRLVLIICILFYHVSVAQEMWGIANSNFAGSAGMSLNPAAMMLMPSKWEANILTVDLSLQNNYLAFARNKVSVNTPEGTPDPHRGVIDYYTPNDKTANAHVMLKLPSFILRTNNNMAFGFHAAVRNDLSVRNVPAALAKFGYEGILYTPLYGNNMNLAGIRVGEMTWAEIGISVGKQLNKSPDKKFLVAATLKGIGALQSAYLNVSSGSFSVRNDSMVTLTNFKGEMHMDVPDKPTQMFTFPGRGAAVDIGFCYVSNSNHETFKEGKSVPIKKYDYRIGVSLIDFGVVNFSRFAKNYEVNSASSDFGRTGSGADSLMNVYEKKGSFLMSLPTALSVQYDYCVRPNVYFNISAIQRIPLPMPHIDRPNQVSATLRYETTFFEVDVPYSFYDYYLHRIGFAVRYRVIFLGSDKLGTFIHNDEITGVDFYFGLKLTNLDFTHMKKTKKAACPAYI